MNHPRTRTLFAATPVLTTTLSAAITMLAQEPPQEPGKEPTAHAPEQPRHRADGERHRLPLDIFAVTPGPTFLVRLHDELSTNVTHEHTASKVKTLNPREAGRGLYVP